MEPHKLTKRELEVYEKLNLDQQLRKIRENHWGDTNIPSRSPELTKRIEQALQMQIPPSPFHDLDLDLGALAALNASIKPKLPPWCTRIKIWPKQLMRCFAAWLYRIAE